MRARQARPYQHAFIKFVLSKVWVVGSFKHLPDSCGMEITAQIWQVILHFLTHASFM